MQRLIEHYFFFLLENRIGQTKNYLLVMEYADGGTLRDYLKKNFNRLTWDDKCNLAYQLACSISCLHDEGIIHRDLVIFFKKNIVINYKINLLSLLLYIIIAFL